MRGQNVTQEDGSDILARNLRDAFDRAFAEAPIAAAEIVHDFVGICLGAESYAVALDEIAGIVPAGRIVSLPSRAGELLGVTSLRGAIVPVYNIALLLGEPAHKEITRWLLVAGEDNPVAFGFERFDGFLRVTDAQLSAADESAAKAHVRAVVMAEGQYRPVISVRSMVGSLSIRAE
jgi:chemotaxis signal transduction protein